MVSDHTDAKPHFPIPQPQAQSFQLKDLEEVISRSQVPFTPQEEKPQIPTVQSQPEKFQSKAEVSELSQLSEICSVAESFSTTTTATLGEKREDEATSKRSGREATSQRLNRSPSSNAPRKRPYSGDSTGARERRSKSPARRAEPSPEKKSQGSSRSIRGRESGQVTTRKLNVGSAGVRRDPSESSGRRSRSPSTRINQSKLSAGGRNQLKPTGVAGRQLTAPAKVVENGNNESEKVEDINDGVPRESLENPHVSMECFIFL
ncbi:CLK4-associating serine/arginine rich protein-like [Senna tora]|uniref:CLK4-associating serine/arginine rich protein-like n=1 Tax=Senna tora TaxID=362788 RepID=A0A834TLF5_9FABA|nr:CLK4-associating serine/arginine rich protein-like [Senna tora]